MGLRCLLGHDFDEPEVEREREEDGNEVVTTVREVKTCARCGETQVVSENTEVTTMERLTEAATSAPTPAERSEPTETSEPIEGAEDAPGGFDPVPNAEDDAYEPPVDGDDAVIIDDGPEPAETDEPAGGAEADTVDGDDDVDAVDEEAAGADGDVAVADDDAEFIDDGPDTAEGTDAGEEPATWPDPTDEPDDAAGEADDGVILDDDGESSGTERERGAWPAVEADEEESGTEPTPWPDQHGEDEGWNATVDDAAEGTDSSVEFGGLTPEAAADNADLDEDVEFIEAPETAGPTDRDGAMATGEADAGTDDASTEGIGSGIAREDPPALRTSSNDVEMEYYCPACGMTREADGNSMRAGDICPSCKRGYINERPR